MPGGPGAEALHTEADLLMYDVMKKFLRQDFFDEDWDGARVVSR